MQPLLIPFFCVFSPTPKGLSLNYLVHIRLVCILVSSSITWFHDAAGELYGPFIKLPIECQMLAFDLMYYFDSFSTSFLKAITRCLCKNYFLYILEWINNIYMKFQNFWIFKLVAKHLHAARFADILHRIVRVTFFFPVFYQLL